MELRAADSDSSNTEIAKQAGYKASNTKAASRSLRVMACRLMKKPLIILALAKLKEDPKTGKRPKITKLWVMKQTRAIIEDSRTGALQKISALKLLAEMIPGALVPVKMEVQGNISLEHWVAAMGGKPTQADAQIVDINALKSLKEAS